MRNADIARRILRKHYGASLRKVQSGYLIDDGKRKVCCTTLDDVFTQLNRWALWEAQEHLRAIEDRFLKNGGTAEGWRDVIETASSNAEVAEAA